MNTSKYLQTVGLFLGSDISEDSSMLIF